MHCIFQYPTQFLKRKLKKGVFLMCQLSLQSRKICKKWHFWGKCTQFLVHSSKWMHKVLTCYVKTSVQRFHKFNSFLCFLYLVKFSPSIRRLEMFIFSKHNITALKKSLDNYKWKIKHTFCIAQVKMLRGNKINPHSTGYKNPHLEIYDKESINRM